MTPKRRLPPLSLSPAPERRLPPDPSLVSHAPLISGSLEDAHNVLLPAFLDGQDDGEIRYDEVALRVLRKGMGPPAQRELGAYRFPVGAFSPWVRVRLSGGPAGAEGFLKLRFDPPSARGLHYLLTPTFLPSRHPFTFPASLGAELYERFGFYLPHEFLSIEVLPSIAEEAVGHARHFFARDDWDLFLYVFGQSDNAHHLIGFGAFDHAVDLNQFLASRGLLRWEAAGVIDHEQTLVFHNMWHLYFNHRLLDEASLRARGVEVALVATTRDSRVDLVSALATLGAMEVNEVLVESGPRLAGALLQARRVDELVLYVAPSLLGSEARALAQLPGLDRLDQRLRMRFTDARQVGDDLRITAVPQDA
jgi:hypothetical protein